jgi:hypothetical protein
MYIDAIKGSALAFVLLCAVAWTIPGRGPSNEVEVVLTISTFLFAILAGFYIQRLNNRYDQIRELVAAEDALWLSFYKIAHFFGVPFQDRIRDLIDEYYLIAFDFDVGEYYKHNASQFLKVFDECRVLDTTNNLASSLIMLLPQIEQNRNTASVIEREELTIGQWAMLIFLAIIVLFSIFYIKTPDLYSQLSVVLLGTVLVLVLLTIRDLQELRLWGEAVAEESGEELFEFIGKPRYYNKLYLDQGVVTVPSHVKTYRLGLHKPGEAINVVMVGE